MKIFLEAYNDIIKDEDEFMKACLLSILKDDGRGNHHALYAKIFNLFDVKVVPVEHEIKTAAIDQEEGVIYFNRGFFRNYDFKKKPQENKTFYQLSVITRHELLHFLLDHQIRMIKLFNEDIPEAHLKLSSSIHSLMNTIQDFEDNDKVIVTEQDKEVLRGAWLNGKLIHGLITEEHRPEWQHLPFEQMYKELEKEMAANNYSGELTDDRSGNLSNDVLNISKYKYQGEDTEFDSVEDFRSTLERSIKISRGPKEKLFAEWAPIFDEFPNKIKDLTKEELDELIKQIKDSQQMKAVTVTSPKDKSELIKLYTPEEKAFAIEIVEITKNKFRYQDDYDAWYAEVMRKAKAAGLTKEQIKELFDCMK